MNEFVHGVRRFLQGDEGATSVEYAIMAGLIATIIVIAVSQLGNEVNNIFKDFCKAFNNNVACS